MSSQESKDNIELLSINTVNKSRYISRWSGHFLHDKPNVAEHHFRVIHWCLLLLEDKLLDHEYDSLVKLILLYASVHDLEEVFTGDIRHDVKRHPNPDLKKIVDSVGKYYLSKEYPIASKLKDTAFTHIKEIVKLADILDWTYDVCNEYALGNRDADLISAATNMAITAFSKLQDTEFKHKARCIHQSMLDEVGIS